MAPRVVQEKNNTINDLNQGAGRISPIDFKGEFGDHPAPEKLKGGAMWLICAAFGFFCQPGQSPAQQARPSQQHAITGLAVIIDGDSIRIGDQQIRLQAIDAPEMDQKCGEAGKEWRCGLAARRRLSEIINNAPVTCTALPDDVYDRFGRFLGFCQTADGIAVNDEMVRSGMARAFTRFIEGKPHQAAFERAEALARQTRRGIWAGPHQAPWDFRAEKREKQEIGK